MEPTEKAIGLEQIQVNSPYGLVQLTDFRLTGKPNQHTWVKFCGMVADTQKDNCIEKASTGDRVEINLTKAGKKTRNLFRGVPVNLAVKHVRDTYYLEVEALSATCLLDVKLKKRSFQNQQMSYKDLFQTVLKNYPKASFIDNATQSAQLQEWLLQFQETDWAFLVRAASHLGVVLIPDHTRENPEFGIGVPEGEAGQLTNFHYTMGKDLEAFRVTARNYHQGSKEIDFTSYRVASNQILNPGDRVSFQGINLVVAQITAEFQQGVFKSEYLLTPKEGLRQNIITNRQLAGTSLRGKVIDRRQDQLRLHLEIDPAQKKEEAYWFKLASRYTAEGNSGWYCMPELGDEMQLYLANDQEESATVIGSLRRDGATNAKTDEPNRKYFGNTQGKELLMDDRQLKFSAKEKSSKKLFIKLDAEEGVELQSDQEIKVQTDSDIIWDAKTISLEARHGVFLVCKQSSLIVDRGVDVKADLVKIEGLVQAHENETKNSGTESEPKPTKTESNQVRKKSPDAGSDGSSTGVDQEVAGSIPIQAAPGSNAEASASIDVLGSIPRRVK